MKKFLIGALIGLLAGAFTFDAEAQRRLGGGRSFGRQSQSVQQQKQVQPPQQAPAQQTAQPTQAAAAGGAAAPARSPLRNALIGAAAGLGLMALASWLGFGETFATILLVALIGMIVLSVLGLLMRRSGSAQPAYGSAGGVYREPAPLPPAQRQEPRPLPGMGDIRPGSAMDEFMRGAAPASTSPWGVPVDFDTAGFLANAKTYFRKLQAAWDAGKLDDLQEFTTNEMFIALTHELRARGGATRTEVVNLDATLLGIESSAIDHLASVRFTGTLRVDGETEQVDEVWNLSKPVDGKTGWLLAGIQQLA
jgi:predicted lipid-binding transport protein (Tim44 family)